MKRSQPGTQSPPPPPPRGIRALTKGVDFGEDIDLVAGLTAAALAANQLAAAVRSSSNGDGAHHHRHRVAHLAKAGLGAAFALVAFEKCRREHEERVHGGREKGGAFPDQHRRGRGRGRRGGAGAEGGDGEGSHGRGSPDWRDRRSRSRDGRVIVHPRRRDSIGGQMASTRGRAMASTDCLPGYIPRRPSLERRHRSHSPRRHGYLADS